MATSAKPEIQSHTAPLQQVDKLIDLLKRRCVALGWLSADHSMRCLIVMPRPIADSGMLTPAFGGGGCHRKYSCTELCSAVAPTEDEA